MTLRELIDELEDAASEYGDDIEVRLAQQPRWAFEYSVDSGDTPVAVAKIRGDRGKRETVAYIGEGRQLGYLPGAAAVALGWAEARDNDDDNDDDDEACPGCGCTPGDGVTSGCNHPDGCGFAKEGA